ncbi:hypothetical protein PPL_04860 [Heterostelium album PN500]|uniref:Uncharacterized protein n=1 Tax=Heterostelium pallidum (strain ATCC 26659 / Pp 5 / PN500) TaxID=670386 RepID=D3B8R7_HETP5|nr:hypothetical protein PPL_04860 [Heterostelium album PN500]EFA82435.1 hypothetical protein PPL_04860 [Heterostelium album PN500]|eukprot:XP_020434552.1 hypothetical protein PPL_04860 [Heterostelium album PN500]
MRIMIELVTKTQPDESNAILVVIRDENAPKATANLYSQALRSYKLIKDYPIEELFALPLAKACTEESVG